MLPATVTTAGWGCLSEVTGRSLAHCKAGCSCCKETALRRMGRLKRVIIFAQLQNAHSLQLPTDTAVSKTHPKHKVLVPQVGCLADEMLEC